MNAIVMTALGKRCGKLWALEDCSISVPEGRVTALLGPSGARKTTILRLLVGLSRPTTGEARVLGKAVGQPPELLELGAL